MKNLSAPARRLLPASSRPGPRPSGPRTPGQSRPGRVHRHTRLAQAGALALGAALVLTGCSRAVTLEPAPDAASPRCARAMVAMPEKVSGEQQRDTTAQGTTAWGEDVILKCGVRVQEPVTDPCVNVNGVDWILKKSEGKNSSRSAEASPSGAAPQDQQQAPSRAGKDQAVQTSDGTWQATTYGRSPAFQVTFDADKVPSSTLLVELQSAVSEVPQQKKCRSLQDTLSQH